MRRYEGNEHHTVVEFAKLGFFLAFVAILSQFTVSKGRPGSTCRAGVAELDCKNYKFCSFFLALNLHMNYPAKVGCKSGGENGCLWVCAGVHP